MFSKASRCTFSTLLPAVYICLLVSLFVAAPKVVADPIQPGFPNIIIILADDLGVGDIHIYHPEEKILTPNIDALARQGILFTDAHSGAGVCSPSRYGLLTGQHFSRQPWGNIKRQLFLTMIDSDRLTLADLLQSRGYHSGAFGKWHLGQTFLNAAGKQAFPGPNVDWSKPTIGGPNDQGFDTYYGVAFGHNHWLHAFMQDRLVTQTPTIFTERYPAKAADFSAEQVMPATTDEMLRYIDWNASERPGKPFFAYFAPVSVHAPLTPSKEFAGSSDVGLYGDFVVQVDASVGAIMERLRRHGIDNNTLVIFTSDNGSHGRTQDAPDGKLYPPGSIEKRYQHHVSGPWRGYKGSIYEGGHRVPFIARWPNRIAPGAVSRHLITLEDVMATAAEIVGVELPTGSAEDSYNLMPYLEQRHNGAPLRTYALFNTRDGSPVLRKDEWVYAFHLARCKSTCENATSETAYGACSLCEPYVDAVPGLDRRQFESAQPEQLAFTGPNGYPMIRRWQWILAYLPVWDDVCEDCGQLYDLAADPGQLDNRWHEKPDVVSRLRSFHDAHVERGRSLGINR